MTRNASTTKEPDAGKPQIQTFAGALVPPRVVGVTRRAVRGTAAAILAVLTVTGTGRGINTAYIERLNATFRAAATPLTRRGRAIARTKEPLQAEMFLVGCAQNFCWEHESLRQAASAEARSQWRGRTPAMAAGLTDHRWTMQELLSYQIPPSPWVAPKRRGRPPKLHQAEKSVAA